MDISGQVLSVVGRNVTVKGVPKIVYDVVFSDGHTYACWNVDKANLAMTTQGQQVDIKTSVTQNGEFTNYKLLDIAPAGQLGAAAVETLVLAGNGATGIQVSGPPLPTQQWQREMSPERESKIVKQSCLATAFNFVGQLHQGTAADLEDEAVAMALSLAKTLYAEVYGQQNVAQSPTEVAAQVNQVIPEAVSVGAGTPDW